MNVSLYNRFSLKYVFLLLTLIILSGSFGFSLAKGKGYEGGFPEGIGLAFWLMEKYEFQNQTFQVYI